MERIAVLADIHGNLPALEAVLADVDRFDVDMIVLDGDMADGPFPAETLDLLEALGTAALWLRGNGDRWLVEAHDGRFPRIDETGDLVRWASSRITPAQRNRLAVLPLQAILHSGGAGRIGFCHATARSDDEMIVIDSPLDHFRAAFAAIDAPTLVVGHCHMPFDRLIDRRRIINAGSVGMPYGHSGASWLLVSGSDMVLRRTGYDVDAAAARIATTGMPGVDDFIATYVKSTPSDREALEADREVIARQRDEGLLD